MDRVMAEDEELGAIVPALPDGLRKMFADVIPRSELAVLMRIADGQGFGKEFQVQLQKALDLIEMMVDIEIDQFMNSEV